MYERGWNMPRVQPVDYSISIIKDYAKKDNVKYMVAHRYLMQEMLENKGEMDAIDWLILGNHYAKAAEEEVAYQCFYMAHLLDHKKIETNSAM